MCSQGEDMEGDCIEKEGTDNLEGRGPVHRSRK